MDTLESKLSAMTLDQKTTNIDTLESKLSAMTLDQKTTNIDTLGLELSTMTLDGKLTNIKFDKKTAIFDLYTHNNIIKIGCNYGTHISEDYNKYFEVEKPKTNRGRKPKKIETTRKKQGNGSHFNSQITFTIVGDDRSIYQVKLFTNGRLQIPGIGNIDISSNQDKIVNDVIKTLINFIDDNKTLKLNVDVPVSLEYVSPILQNYKFKIDLKENIEFIDLFVMKKEFQELKDIRNMELKIHSVIFHPERYAGLLIKFSTPELITKSRNINKFIELVKLYRFKKITKKRQKKNTSNNEEDNSEYSEDTKKFLEIINKIKEFWVINNKVRKKIKPKQTTVKIFKSGKINIDNANSIEEANIIKNILSYYIVSKRAKVIYSIQN